MQYELSLLDWSQLQQWKEYEIVIAGTSVSSYLLFPQEEMKTRGIFDLGVPRNVDPCLARDPHCVLYNIDTIVEMMEKKQNTQRDKLSVIENILQNKVNYYLDFFQEKRTQLCV